jgi:hypothetical protein
LKYKKENETILLMRNDVDEFDDLIPTFFDREENKFELYDDNMNTIDDCVYTFQKD